jgi:hypothetical protein
VATVKKRILVVGPKPNQYEAIKSKCPQHEIKCLENSHGASGAYKARWDLVVFMIRFCAHNKQRYLTERTKTVFVPSGGTSAIVRVIQNEFATPCAANANKEKK